jgi:hypothetical protein
LAALGVDVGKSLRFVVATHWHDDHIQGISTVFREAKTALFACTAAVRAPEFQEVLTTWTGTRFFVGRSGIDELRSVLAELKSRLPQTRYPAPKSATANKVLWEHGGHPPAMIKALSPSDAAVLATLARLQPATPQFSRARRRLPDLKPNDASVVLSVQVGHQKVLLGGDLEVRADRGLGWLAIVDAVEAGASQHQAFKVPHHGSRNGDHDEIWSRMLIPEPWAATTPFIQGNVRLPSATDCQRLLRRTPHAYLTAPPHPAKFHDANRTVEKTVGEATISAHFLPGKYGHVRLRKRTNEPAESPWKVALQGNALSLAAYVATPH